MCSNKTHLKFLEYGAAFVGCGRWIINTSTECRIDCATALVRVLRYELAKCRHVSAKDCASTRSETAPSQFYALKAAI